MIMRQIIKIIVILRVHTFYDVINFTKISKALFLGNFALLTKQIN